MVGDDDGEVPPVPIPNTVVKLVYGDNTWLATAREDKSMPTQSKTGIQKGSGLFRFGEMMRYHLSILFLHPAY